MLGVIACERGDEAAARQRARFEAERGEGVLCRRRVVLGGDGGAPDPAAERVGRVVGGDAAVGEEDDAVGPLGLVGEVGAEQDGGGG